MGKKTTCVGLEQRIKKLEKDAAYPRLIEDRLRFLSLVTEQVAYAVLTTDLDFKINWANQAFQHLYGYSLQEIIGKSPDFLNVELMSKKIQSEIYKTVSSGKTWNGEVINRRKDGSTFPCELLIFPLVNEQGNIFAYAGHQRDISKRKQMERTLKKSEELYRTLVENIELGISLIDSDYNIIMVNAITGKIFNKAASELIGKKCYKEFEKRKKICSHCPGKRSMDTGLPQEVETEGVLDDCTHVPVFIRTFPIFDSEGKPSGFVKVVENIAERKLIEEKMNNYQKKLRSLSSELSLTEERERRHIATDLHDYIGQNLAISRIKIKALQKSSVSADRIQPLEEVLKLIEQSIMYTRSLMFELSPSMLYDLGFESAIEWLTERIKKQHGISTSFKDDKHHKPLNDEVSILLFRAVRELLINVVKHGQASNANVSVWKDGRNIRINVNDDGIGFDVSKIRFYGNETGGFGLFNIQERLNYLGGSFAINSKPGKGTSITLMAPLKERNLIPNDYVI